MTTLRNPAVPGTGHETDPAIRRAYWDALTLMDAGWQLRKMRFDSFTRTAAIDLHTPTHRAVTIHSAGVMPTLPFADTARAIRLAGAVAELGRRNGDQLSDLQWLLSEHVHVTNRTPQPRRDRVPDPTLLEHRVHQPVSFRTAYWLLDTLVIDYSWLISDIGAPAAGSGFIADIPGDVTAVFPASMQPDGTTAAQLARLIPQLDPRSLDYLRRITPCALTAARHAIGP